MENSTETAIREIYAQLKAADNGENTPLACLRRNFIAFIEATCPGVEKKPEEATAEPKTA